MWIVVTGGAGYIGSHICITLLNAGYKVVIIDNFVNASPKVIDRIKKIVALETMELAVFEMDISNDKESLRQVFQQFAVAAVIHLAGLKAVGESVREPVKYYSANIGITCNLLDVMREYQVTTLVHSSSATVYGDPLTTAPLEECCKLKPLSPYGRSKLFIEEIIRDAHQSCLLDRVAILRYFNPVGAHPSGLIGEDPKGFPNNLMPAISQSAIGKLPGKALCVFGGDYDTVDGTGVRDYIHVMDLARGHVLALDFLASKPSHFDVYNLGTGIGYSVLQVIQTFAHVSGRPIDYKVVDRRPGDVPVVLAAVEKARSILGFYAEHDLKAMCRDAWKWQSMNPNGYYE